MRLLKASVCLLGFFALISFPGTAFSEEILLFAYSYMPNVCSHSATDDYKPIVHPDLSVPGGVPPGGTTPILLSDEEMESIPAEGIPPSGPTFDLLTDEELDSISAEGLVVTFEGRDGGEPAIILWDEAMGTVTAPEGYGEVYVERR